MFLVSLGWQVSVELAVKTGITFNLSCPKFEINFPKFWWEQVEMTGCPGAEGSDCIISFGLFLPNPSTSG